MGRLAVVFVALILTGTLLSALACTKTFSPSSPAGDPSATATFTGTATLTGTTTPTPTPTSQTTSTKTPTPSPTPLVSVTATPTGCASTAFHLDPNAQSVLGGTTAAVTCSFGTNKIGYACDQSYSVTSIVFDVETSFSGTAKILQTQLWQGGVMVGSSGASNGGSVTFTGSPLLQSPAGQAGNFSVEYVLDASASGSIVTELTGVTGNGSAGFFWSNSGASTISGTITVSP